MDAQTFGERLRAARHEKGWTQGDLCVELRRWGFRYNDGNVRAWEKGRRWPEARAIPHLAMALGVTTDYLFGLDEGAEPEGRSGEVRPADVAADLAEAVRAAAERVRPRGRSSAPPGSPGQGGLPPSS